MSESNHVVSKDGDVNLDKVDNAIDLIDVDRRDRILSDFGEFKSYLHKRINLGMSIGLNEEQLASIAEKVADYTENGSLLTFCQTEKQLNHLYFPFGRNSRSNPFSVYLSANEEPRNSEEKLLQELWNVGTKEERHMLAHMLLRMAQNVQ